MKNIALANRLFTLIVWRSNQIADYSLSYYIMRYKKFSQRREQHDWAQVVHRTFWLAWLLQYNERAHADADVLVVLDGRVEDIGEAGVQCWRAVLEKLSWNVVRANCSAVLKRLGGGCHFGCCDWPLKWTERMSWRWLWRLGDIVVEFFHEVSCDCVGGLGVLGDDVVVGVDDGDRALLFHARKLSNGFEHLSAVFGRFDQLELVVELLPFDQRRLNGSTLNTLLNLLNHMSYKSPINKAI